MLLYAIQGNTVYKDFRFVCINPMFHLTCQIYWMNSYLNYSTAHSPNQFLAEKFANIRKTLILNILKIALTLYYVYNVTNSLIRSAHFWPPNLLSAHICDCNIKLIFTHLANLTVPWQNITPAVSNIGLLNCGNPTHWSLFYTIKMTEEQGIIFCVCTRNQYFSL